METELGHFLRRLQEISQAMLYTTEARELHVVLDRIAHAAKELAGTRYAALGVPDGQGGLRYFRTAGMTPEEIAMIDHLPRGHGLIGAIMTERRVIRLSSIQSDKRSSGFPPHHPPMTSFLGVPVQAGTQLYGMLYLCDKRNGEPFDEFDELIVQTVASYAALAISGAEVANQSRQIQLLEERERIGMALHDGVIQSLYGIGMQVNALRGLPEVSEETLSEIVHSLDDVIEDIRGFISQLMTRRTADNLRAVLEQAIKRVILPPQVLVELHLPPVPLNMPADHIDSLALMVREAVSNAARHANPSRIQVFAEVVKNRILINIYDDGRGFESDHARDQAEQGKGGMGLMNMHQRAQAMGGSIVVDSAPGKGTHVLIMVPNAPLNS
ncbi:GAF domain-containing sensor histidine kinase [Aggregatilineales bacterium SYSU G02658]